MSSPACCSPEKSMENSRLQAQRSNESPSGAFKRRSGLAQQDGGALPRQVPPRCTECRQCKEKHGFPAGVQKVCRAPENGKSHEESFDSSWDFGALEGTRIPGPLIKRAGMAHISIHGSCVISPFYDESPRFSIVWFVHPLSDFATEIHLCILCDRAKTVQKPCTYSRTN